MSRRIEARPALAARLGPIVVASIMRLFGLALLGSVLAVGAWSAEAVVAPASVQASCDGWISTDSSGSAPKAGHQAQDSTGGSATWSIGDIRIKLPSSFYCLGWANDSTTYKYNGMGTQMVAADWSGKYYWMPMNPSGSVTNCTYAGTTNASNSGITDYMKAYVSSCVNAAFPVGTNASAFGVSQNTAYTNWGIGYASCTTFYSAQTVISQTSSASGPAKPGANCGSPAWKGPDTFTSPKLDWSAPTADFSTPNEGTTTIQSSTSLSVSWSEADTGGSGVSTRSLQRQKGAVANAGSCSGVSWSNDGSPDTGTNPRNNTGLSTGFCYRWIQTLTDTAGNTSATTSGSVLIDTTAPSAPSVTCGPATGGTGSYQAAANGTCWFRPAAASTLTMTSTGTDSQSDIASSTFGSFNPTTGWTYSSGNVSGNPASKNATFASNAVSTGLNISTTNKAGLTSGNTAFTITIDSTAPSVAFTLPAAGGPAFINNTAYTVTFNATDASAGLGGTGGTGSWSLQRQLATATNGTCGTFANDGSPASQSTSGTGLTNGQTLTSGNCYRWTLSATDNVGNAASAVTSGTVLVDTAVPTGSFTAPSLSTVVLGPELGTSTANGANAWSNPGNALIDGESVWASSGSVKNTVYTLYAKGFSDLSAIPADATISLVSVTYDWWASASTSNATLTASMTYGTGPTSICSNAAQNATTTHTTSTWTSCTPTRAQLVDPEFAIKIAADTGIFQGQAAATFSLAWAKLEVRYTSVSLPSANIAPPNYTVAFSTSDTGGSGVASWQLAREKAAGTPTTCATFSADGTTNGTGSGSQTGPQSDLVKGNCYRWTLTVTDAAGNSSAPLTSAAIYAADTDITGGAGEESYYTRVPFDLGGGWRLAVGVHNGEATLERDLLNIPSYGPAQSLSLRYSSAETSAAGRFGTGWNSNLTQYLTFGTDLVVWHRADGGRVAFTYSGGAWTVGGAHYETLADGSGADAGRKVLTLRDQSKLLFQGSGTGRLQRIQNRFGKSLTLSWASSSATATDSSGRATTLTIDAANDRVTGVTDSAGRAWSFGYTGTDLTSITDPASKVTTLAYDGSHRLTSVTRTRTAADNSSVNLVWSVGYTSGKATSVTDALGQTTSPVTSHTLTYNAGSTTVGLLKDTTNPASPVRNVWTYTLDANGWPTAIADPESWITNRTYDTKGNLLTTSHPIASGVNPVSSYTYDAAGNVLTQTDPIDATRNRVTTMIYNASNDLTQRAEASNDIDVELVTKFGYDGSGHRTSQIVNCTSSGTTPPANGALCSGAGTQDVATNLTTSYTWTANDQLDTETDPLGHVTKHQYDNDGNETSVTRNYVSGQPATADQNVTTSNAYDQGTSAGKAGLPTSSTDALGAVTTLTYNALGQMTSQVDPGDASIDTHKTTHSLDELGNEIQTKEFWPSTDSTAKRTRTVVLDRLNRPVSTDRDGVVSNSSFDAAGNVVSETAGGVTTTRSYDGLGRVLTEAAGGTTTTTTYDGQGRDVSAAQSGAGTTGRAYDYAGDQLSETEDQGGANLTTTHSYDRLGRELTSTTPDAATTTNTHDRPGRITRSVVAGDTSTLTTDTAYDKNGNVVTSTAPYRAAETPVVTKTNYDGLDRPSDVIANFINGSNDPNANLTTTTYYDAAGKEIAVVDPKDAVNRSLYNVRGLAIKTIANCTNDGTTKPTDPATCAGTGTTNGSWNVTTILGYDGSGMLTSSRVGENFVADGSGPVTTNRIYDGAGRLIQVVVDTANLNLTTNYGYDSAGRESAVQDPRGTITRTIYDSASRVSQVVVNCTNTGTTIPTSGWESCAGTGTHDATWNVTTTYGYDSAGHKSSETAPNGRVTTFGYDNAGRLTSRTENDVANPTHADDDLTTFFYYDPAGRQAAIKSPTVDRDTFIVTRYLYDDLGRRASEIVNCTNSGTTPPSDPATCTGAGTADSSTNVVTSYTYDSNSQKLSVTGPDPSTASTGTATVVTRYAYDANGRLCRVLENASVDLQTLTDPCATAVSGSSTSNVSTRYTHDENGNLASMIDAAGHTTAYTFDALGRMTSLTDADNHSLSWTYDIRGNRLSQSNRDGTLVSWGYDGGDRIIVRHATGLPDVTYQYDANGNRTSAADGTRTVSTTYDRLNRPLTVTVSDDASASTSYTYDFSNPSWTDPSGAYVASLDPFGRETSLLDPIHGSTAWTTAYRADGQMASRLDPTANTTTLAYDPLGRLTAKTTTGSGGSPTRAAYTFTYNRAGQRVAETSTVTGDSSNGAVAYTYDQLARLASYARDGADPVTYGWQPVPNRSSLQVDSNPAVTTTFDNANRPLSDSAGGSYSSDNDGRLTLRPGQTLQWDSLGRLTNVLSSPGGSTLATYSYDPLDRLRMVDHGGSDRTRFRYVGLTTSVAEIVDDTNGSVVRNVGTSWSGELRMDWTGAGVSQRIYGTNGHQDVTWIAGPDGTVAGSLRYDPWGTVVASSGAGLPDFRFQTSWQDSTTSVLWAKTRWYAPSLGTFLSEDGLLGQPEQPASRHLYAYGTGEPVGRWDPDGRFWYLVKSGDTLASISNRYWFTTSRWPTIWNANRNRIVNPSVIYPWQCIWLRKSGYYYYSESLGRSVYYTYPNQCYDSWDNVITGNFPDDRTRTAAATLNKDWYNLTRSALVNLTVWQTRRVANPGLLSVVYALQAAPFDVVAMPFSWTGRVVSNFASMLVVAGSAVPVPAGKAFTAGHYVFEGSYFGANDPVLWHEYIHVLQYEGGGLSFLTDYASGAFWAFVSNAELQGPVNNREAMGYLWQGWGYAFRHYGEHAPWCTIKPIRGNLLVC